MILPESPTPPHPPVEQETIQKSVVASLLTPEEQKIKDMNDFRATLPITQFKGEIGRILMDETFIIVTGETGSGKSTQLPQFIMDNPELKDRIIELRKAYYQQLDESGATQELVKKQQQALSSNQDKYKSKKKEYVFEDRRNTDIIRIAVTQPRRMAAISMAKRLAFERNESLGVSVGYTIRFDNMTSDQTTLKYMTDGILVRECLQDMDLKQYDVVVLDEAHERSLYTDVLFALVKMAAEKRKGSLKVIITSATLNVALFRGYFNECPMVKVHGKSYPVEVKFSEQPVNGAKRTSDAVNAALRMHLHEGPGDILVFLAGSEDCEMARKQCFERLEEVLNAGRDVPNVLLYTLYGNQSSEDQSMIFQKVDEDTRKIIFCTNIAETSLTIDNIGFVIDGGYVKQKTYNPRTGMDSLLLVPISKTQSIQRMGRAGRTQSGKCYRLYTKQFFEHMNDHSIAEIMRVNLASVLLLLKSMGIDDVVRFQFMEMPSEQALLQSLRQLYLLGAIEQKGYITQLGYEMSRYPLEPSYAKVMITSKMLGCQENIAIIIALLSTESIWLKVTKVDQEGSSRFWQVQEENADLEGDHYSLLRLFKLWKESGMSEQFVKDNMLNARALRQAENIRVQLLQLCESASQRRFMPHYEQDYIYRMFKKHSTWDKQTRKNKSTFTDSQLIKLTLCTGFYFNTARKMANAEDSYLMVYPEGTVVDVDVSSVYALLGQYPDCVIFTELGGTSLVRGVMRLLTSIDISWVKPYFTMMVKVDLFKLARIEFDQERQGSIVEKKIQREEVAKQKLQEEEQQKKDKISQYKQNYMGRKKTKIE